MRLSARQTAIVTEILRLHRRRQPLNIPAVKWRHPQLLQRVYAVRPFWGWKQALAAAGLGYKQINVELRDYVDCRICGRDSAILTAHLASEHAMTPAQYREEFPGAEILCETVRAKQGIARGSKRTAIRHWESIWTPEYVLDRMAELHRQGFPLNFNWIGTHEKSLGGHAIRFFGGWDEALRRIGLDPAVVRRQVPGRHVDAAEVITRLRARERQGLPLHEHAVTKSDLQLWNAARRRFGSYAEALRAAGFNAERLRRKLPVHPPETLTRVLQEAERIAKLRGEAHARVWKPFCRRYGGLAAAYFGGWKNVAAEIGVPAGRLFGYRFADREDVMCALRKRVSQAKSLWSSHVFEEDRALYTAVRKYLGSYAEVYRLLDMPPPRQTRSLGGESRR